MWPCFQYVAYAEGLIRAYNIHTYAVLYTLQRETGVTSLPSSLDCLACTWIYSYICLTLT